MAEQPNILVIWGDDIGQSNLSCYTDGLMGYRTPHIDRIAEEGVRFTDYYGEQSCTAGRAAFIMGQNPFRTGLTKVGLPGADIGIRSGSWWSADRGRLCRSAPGWEVAERLFRLQVRRTWHESISCAGAGGTSDHRQRL